VTAEWEIIAKGLEVASRTQNAAAEDKRSLME